jgi:hypothetical protein
MAASAASARRSKKAARDQLTPDADKYEIKQFKRVGDHVVLRVLYPNCKLCAYDGVKVMVFLNVSEGQMLHWKRIDPHFRGNEYEKHEAPSPAARFPGNEYGWKDAVAFAESKTTERRQA